MILNRFKKNHAFYYAALTAYYTGLRVSEVFALTWDDIDLENKTLTVIEKNHIGSTHGRHLSGKAKTVWYFGNCKTPSSYRTIDIGNTLVNALKEFKEEQARHKEEYEDSNFIIDQMENMEFIEDTLNSEFTDINKYEIEDKILTKIDNKLAIQYYISIEQENSYNDSAVIICYVN